MEFELYHLLLLYIISNLVYNFATDFVYQRGETHYNVTNSSKILDTGFDLISDKRHDKLFYQCKEAVCALMIIVFFIFLFTIDKQLLAEYVITFCIVWLIKCTLFVSTILPDPSERCQKYSFFAPHKGSCHDLIISTHCCFLFVFLIMAFKYNLFGWGNWILLLTQLYVVYSIISLRQHYTMDIVNAFVYCFFVNIFVSDYLMKK